jgi:hypothetical protein
LVYIISNDKARNACLKGLGQASLYLDKTFKEKIHVKKSTADNTEKGTERDSSTTGAERDSSTTAARPNSTTRPDGITGTGTEAEPRRTETGPKNISGKAKIVG